SASKTGSSASSTALPRRRLPALVTSCFHSLHCYLQDCSQAAIKFSGSSGCETHQFVGVRLACGQDCSEDAAAFGGLLQAHRPRDLGKEPVGVKQGQTPRDFGGLRAALFYILGRPEEQKPDLAIAKTLQSPFATVDRGQQLGVVSLKRVEGSIASSVPSHRLA